MAGRDIIAHVRLSSHRLYQFVLNFISHRHFPHVSPEPELMLMKCNAINGNEMYFYSSGESVSVFLFIYDFFLVLFAFIVTHTAEFTIYCICVYSRIECYLYVYKCNLMLIIY